MNTISKPKNRTALRRKLGKEYYIFKRKIKWFSSSTSWAKQNQNLHFEHLVFCHQSLILRPLSGVDMRLRINLQLAIQHLDKMVIQPKETFSIWKNVGRPTHSKGYLEGLILNQGKIESGTGGGLCQLGNLLYWIFAHSPLTITERYRHGFDVFPDVNRKVPFGAGATLSYNYIDLQAFNPTENSFQILLNLNDKYLVGELYSQKPIYSQFKIEERDARIQQQYWGGYTRHNRIIQIEEKANGEIIEKELASNHAIMMYNPLLD